MEVLSFDISGKMAHFRKFHANNTALSYSIPPRTTIIGMLAAILGREKNSYYEEMAHPNLKIGLRVLSDLRKSFHRLNYLMIKSKDDFTGRSGRVQTPFEVVMGDNLKSSKVTYRIFVAAGGDGQTFNELKDALSEKNQRFNISLGPANFTAFIENVRLLEVSEKTVNGEMMEMHSACNSDQVLDIELDEDASFSLNFIEEELLPADFKANDDRELKAMNRVLFSTRKTPLKVRLEGTVYQTEGSGEKESIQFLEYVDMVAQP